MYSILIVEDVPVIRSGIVHMVKSYDQGLFMVTEASDGLQALEHSAVNSPDIVITDIQMPEQNGLQLIEETLKNHPETRFIIISGYADFAYAQRAIDLGVTSYLLKPVDRNELFQALARITSEIEAGRSISRQLDTTKSLEDSQKQHMIQGYLNTFLIGEDSREQSHAITMLSYYGVPDNSPCVLMLIRFGNPAVETIESSTYFIEQALASHGLEGHVFSISGNRRYLGVFLFGSEPEKLPVQWTAMAQIIFDRIPQHPCHIGISSIHLSLSPCLYSEAMAALQRRLSSEDTCVFQYHESAPFNCQERLFALNPMRHSLAARNRQECFKNLRFAFEEWMKKDLNRETLPLFCQQISSLIIESLNLNQQDISTCRLLDMNLPDRFETLELLENHFKEILDRHLPKTSELTEKDIYQHVLTLIQNHFTKTLSVTEMAEELHISPSHLSNVFRKFSGNTISDTIRTLRFQKAAELLKETALPISIIGEAVGYPDIHYFYRRFKQQLGSTPMEYRRRNSCFITEPESIQGAQK